MEDKSWQWCLPLPPPPLWKAMRLDELLKLTNSTSRAKQFLLSLTGFSLLIVPLSWASIALMGYGLPRSWVQNRPIGPTLTIAWVL